MPNQPTSYMSQQISWSNNPNLRNGTSTGDARLVNCFIESIKTGANQPQQEYIVSRGGLQYQFDTAITPIQLGIYYYEGHIYSAAGNTLYKDGVSYQTLSGALEPLGFVEFINDVAQKSLIVLDGLNGYVINPVSGTITQITSPNFPTPHCTRAVFIDGYLCVAKKDTADLYNSNLNDPSLWTAGDFISAEMAPDTILGLYKQNNYVVAIGGQTTEYFYNEGSFPGTPFARNPAGYHRVGVTDPSSVATFEEQLLFVGNSGLGGRTIYRLVNFQLIDIATPPVRRWVDQATSVPINAIISGSVIRTQGHAFFLLTIRNASGSRTFVYDLTENNWCEWGNASATNGFSALWMTDHPDGTPYFLMENTGIVCNLVPTKATDDVSSTVSTPITIVATSNKVDYGSMNRKFANRFTLACDSTTGASSINLQYSDDDYKTWSTARTLTISDTMTTVQQLGFFRRRAWRLTYSQPYPLRIEGAELTINMGTA